MTTGNNCLTKILIILLIFSLTIIGLLINKSYLNYDLEKETYQSLLNFLGENEVKNAAEKDHFLQILELYEDRKNEIERITLNNGLTSLLVTVLIILSSIKKIIRSIKDIIYELINGKKIDRSDCKTAPEVKETHDYDNVLKKLNEYQQLKELLLLQLNKLKEHSGEHGEKTKLIEKTMMLLIEEFIGNLGQTSKYAMSINSDKEQLIAGMNEIKNGMDRIIYVINEDDHNKDAKMSKEEIMAALQQIDNTIEETASLIMKIDKKARALSEYIDQYKEGNGKSNRTNM